MATAAREAPPADDWATFDAGSAPVAVARMRLNGDGIDDLVVLSEEQSRLGVSPSLPSMIFTVTNTDDSGTGSLRWAMEAANANPGNDTIAFNIPGTAVITPLTRLPVLTDPVFIDGTTQPGYMGAPRVGIDIQNVPTTEFYVAAGLWLLGPGHTLRALWLSDPVGPTTTPSHEKDRIGILIDEPDSVFIEDSITGYDFDTLARDKITTGIFVKDQGAVGSLTIGGAATSAGNILIAENPLWIESPMGLTPSGEVRIEGNSFQTSSPPYDSPGAGGSGIFVGTLASAITVGGTATGAANSFDTFGPCMLVEGPASDLLVQGNRLGPDRATAQSGDGIRATGLTVSNIGGTTTQARNIISNNYIGIRLISPDTSGNVIRGNYIGVDETGLIPLPNGDGITIDDSSGNIIGGAGAAGNIISGNTANGVKIESTSPPSTSASGNFVLGNMIGTDTFGTVNIGNGFRGVSILNASGNIIGSTIPTTGNVISGNAEQGVFISGSEATANELVGNLIGPAPNGIWPVSNSAGVVISDAPGNVIGGLVPAAGNVISSNEQWGIYVTGADSFGNQISYNIIGLDKFGTGLLPNNVGIYITTGAEQNYVGELMSGQVPTNVISGNTDAGVILVASDYNTIRGSFIGTDITGTLPRPNGTGIRLLGGDGAFIGDFFAGGGNLISGNSAWGVDINGNTTSSVYVYGNRIGTDVTGANPLPNGGGVRIVNTGLRGIEVGGVEAYLPNTIAFNGLEGILVDEDSQNVMIRGNSIHSNVGLGIDLLPGPGMNFNDAGDGDVGANGLQNFPFIDSVDGTGGSAIIHWELESTPNTDFSVEFFVNGSCDPLGAGEGATMIGTLDVTTDATGYVSRTDEIPFPLFDGDVLTGTATTGFKTSEFSECAEAAGVPPSSTMSLTWTPGSTSSLEWDPVPGATSYNIYEEGGALLPNLGGPGLDSCLRASTTSTITGDVLLQVPPPGGLVSYLVAPMGIYGEGGVGESASGPRVLDSTGTCGASCGHDLCMQGPAVPASCDVCAAAISAIDPYCSTTTWDGFCVAEMRSVCGSLRCSTGQGLCSHTLCTQGGALVSGCDSPPVNPSCVTRICAADPYCCGTAWDGICVGEVVSVCNLNCN